jgi:hypothetical protein
MVSGEARVICLEEVRQTREEAVRRFSEAIGRTSAQMLEGFTRFGEAARAAAGALAGLRRAQQLGGWPDVHAFTPDFDLRCSVRGCGLGPEEHDLW